MPNTSVMTVSNLLDRMAAERGTLVCSGDCTIVEISEARADCRFAVMNDGIGFVYRPRVTTEESLRIIADAPITKELKNCVSIRRRLIAADGIFRPADCVMNWWFAFQTVYRCVNHAEHRKAHNVQ